jgi:hypothetical protein
MENTQLPGFNVLTTDLECSWARRNEIETKQVGSVRSSLPLSFAVAQDSHYTRHDYDSCEEAPSPEPGIIDVRRCIGLDGVAVTWISEPDSSSVQFGDDPLDEYLDLGAAFEVGTTIEWRTAEVGGSPVAAIVRYRAGDSVANPARSRLVIYRLAPSGRSCVLGMVTGAGDNLKAREVADRHAAAFVCGTSKQIGQ